MTPEEYKTLILRGSRQLGSSLVEIELVSEEDLEKANQKLLSELQGGNLKNANLLKILIYDLQVFDEAKLLRTSKFPLIDLANFDLVHPSEFKIDFDLCTATWTLPFDKEENFYFVATACSLSEPIIKHWEELIPKKNLIWYTTSLSCLSHAFETLAQKKEEARTKPE